jgi:lactoylglutathione lyase
VVSYHHSGLTVTDIERSLLFWGDGLGLELDRRQEREGGYVESITGESGVHMLQAHLRSPDSSLRVELLQFLSPVGRSLDGLPRDPGHGHVAVVCEDLPAVVERLLAAGGIVRGRPVEIDAGINQGWTAVYVTDTDGHVVELMEPPNR